MFGDTTFDVARPTGVCSATGRAIAPGETFVAALIERDADEKLERRDYSQQGWADAAHPSGERVVASWRAVMPRPEDRSGRLLDDAGLADLFEQVCEPRDDETPARGAFRYLLALLLIRRRVLRHAGTRQGDLLVRWTRDGERADTISVADPGLDPAVLAGATEQLSAVLLGAPAPKDPAS